MGKKCFKNSSFQSFGFRTNGFSEIFNLERLKYNISFIVPAQSFPAQTEIAKNHFGENAMVPYRAYWALKTAQEDVATWAPSGSDTLAEDWMVLD